MDAFCKLLAIIQQNTNDTQLQPLSIESGDSSSSSVTVPDNSRSELTITLPFQNSNKTVTFPFVSNFYVTDKFTKISSAAFDIAECLTQLALRSDNCKRAFLGTSVICPWMYTLARMLRVSNVEEAAEKDNSLSQSILSLLPNGILTNTRINLKGTCSDEIFPVTLLSSATFRDYNMISLLPFDKQSFPDLSIPAPLTPPTVSNIYSTHPHSPYSADLLPDEG